MTRPRTSRTTIVAGRTKRHVAVERREVGPIRASSSIGKWDIGCAASGATKPETRPDLSTGALAADVARHIRPSTGAFERELWGDA